jgi:hypothetical protein
MHLVSVGRDIVRGSKTPVQLLVDASDSNTARLMSGYASRIVQAYNAAAVPPNLMILLAVKNVQATQETPR